MSAPTSPSWYDVLEVADDASPDEIRAAWRDGIADLSPGDRRFRLLNQAAEVLLDDASRRSYDDELAPPPPVTSTVDPTSEATAVEGPVVEVVRAGPPTWVLLALGILTALAVAAAAYLLVQPSDDSIASSTDDAQSAAERAVTTILAYDYRQMDADQSAADALMTPSYASKYNALFAQLKANAATVKPVVTAQVLSSGVVLSGDDRVQILVFVNRPTTRADGQARVFHDQVRVTMVESGDDWLVDDLQTGASS